MYADIVSLVKLWLNLWNITSSKLNKNLLRKKNNNKICLTLILILGILLDVQFVLAWPAHLFAKKYTILWSNYCASICMPISCPELWIIRTHLYYIIPHFQ